MSRIIRTLFVLFSFSITEIGRVLGTQTIQTHAGKFEDCLKVEYRAQTEKYEIK